MAALFGAKKRAPFDMPMPGPIGGFGGGTFEADGTPVTPVQRDTMGQGALIGASAPKKQSFFGEGGAGRNIAGYIGDFLLQRSGAGPIYAPAMQQQQQSAAQLAADQRKRSLDLADYRSRKGIDQEFGGEADLYSYFDDNAGNRWRQNKQTGQVDAAPVFIDRTPKEFVHEGMRFSIPNPYLRGAGGETNAALPTFSEDDWQKAGGTGGNVGGNFR